MSRDGRAGLADVALRAAVSRARFRRAAQKRTIADRHRRTDRYGHSGADLDAPDEMVLSSAAEFTVGALKRAQRWKPDSVEWAKLREVFKPFLATMRHNFEDDFHAALADQLVGQNRAVRVELCALMPSLQHHLEAPCPHPAHTVGAHDTKTRRHLDETKTRKDENYTDQNSRENVQPFTSLSFAEVGSAEKGPKTQGPRSQTIEAARRIGAIP